MERRKFLGALTAASLGVVVEGSFTEFGRAQNAAQTDARAVGQSDFKTSQVEVSGNKIFVRRYGQGPAILMVHGFPRTSLMWRSLAPKLAESRSVICVDLRAYGRSGTPASTDDHFPYSKRAMANELVEVMTKLGFPSFTLIGHDRGGRVSYRMALDHPKNVERPAVFDVIPMLEAWNRADARFAQTYWPWSSCRRNSHCRRVICSALLRPSFITRSAKVPSDRKFWKSTFPPIANRPACMASVRNIEQRQRSMSNTTARTKKRRKELNARCCTCGRRVVGLTLTMQKTAVRWAFGGNGLRTSRGRR